MNSILFAVPRRAPGRVKSAIVMAPLLLSLAVSAAWAAPTVITGANGANGADGSATAINGGAGTAGQTVVLTLAPAGLASNVLTLSGGNGGNGGAGWPGVWDDNSGGFIGGGNGGSGADGGQASGAVRTLAGAVPAVAASTVIGGNGGHAGAISDVFAFHPGGPGLGQAGNGGAATSSASAIASGAADVLSRAVARGGNGGDTNDDWNSLSGVGGGASATAFGRSDSGNVIVGADAIGGNGGAAGANTAGGAGAAVALDNAVSGATSGRLSLSQSATGGDAGMPGFRPAGLATGGSARSTLTLADSRASALSAAVAASGGAGGHGAPPGDGGAAQAALTLSSSRGGAAVTGTVSASGGAGGISTSYDGTGGRGGDASATATLGGRAAVSGSVTTRGGQALGMNLAGGNASATLAVTAGALASGTAAAYGGSAYGDSRAPDLNGAATALLTLAGAGATGSSVAQGAGADATVRATTTGAQAVNVVSSATGMTNGGETRALTGVVTAADGGRAAVVANATANGTNSGNPASATVNVVARGDITGTSQATGGYIRNAGYGVNAGAASTISGETGGASAVTLGALARGDVGDGRGTRADFGNASANAYGRSGSGVVNVTAEARGGSAVGTVPLNVASAQATAVAAERGGVGTARALASGSSVDVRASAQAFDSRGNAVGFTAGAGGVYAASGAVLASSRYDAAAFALAPSTTGSHVAGNAAAAPASAAQLGLGPKLAPMSNLVGVGSQTLANASAAADIYPETGIIQQSGFGQFQFTSAASEHLLIGFVSSRFLGGGFDALELSISNNGVQLFAQSFTSLADANLFFNDHLLDLGVFGAGRQNLSINSTVSTTQPSAYAFNYVLGLGLGGKPVPDVSVVPEPSAWLMMLIGVAGMVLVARRRAQPPHFGESTF